MILDYLKTEKAKTHISFKLSQDVRFYQIKGKQTFKANIKINVEK